ncbi:DUF92 domain-containing protein [Cuniculiplasma divulgatum]|uniref:Multipass membrane protein n=1 Tax=Cuniculiplasma divulgatum TaxID=1673428 RepID=A0A1R4A8F9_9ARCH|nr:DUF92 domain-containing protein [Cuniculiplasma divulgatum]WMT49587.1 MAG: DUF92 domain-containing protein [Thermoplasmatales archaeon]SJK85247.1 multipass membrane protein [Cuniculiplasma divulgatum]
MLEAFNFYYVLEVLIVLVILFFLSQIFKLFDAKGAIGAVIIGAIVSFAGNLNWLILLILFAFFSHLATKYKFEEKMKLKQQEGTRGERKISNVAYGGAIGVMIALSNLFIPFNFPFFIMFAAAFAAITSDTFGSEIGVLDDRTYLITTFRRCETGINGGISIIGTFAAFLGSFLIALSYVILTRSLNWEEPFFLILVAGFLGSNIDSLLGAIFENKNKMSKGQVNLVASIVAVLFVVPFLL